MEPDLADYIEGTPGRFVPHQMRGELVEAEHLARYRWATRLAAGRRVLDAGCGMAYGSAMLAGAGATAVTGVDVAADVLDAVRGSMPPRVELVEGDVRRLPFDDDSFDLVVCFEVIEHIEDQERAVAEMRRVLAPGGQVLVSSPNRESYVPGNPHHVHELTPDELTALVRTAFPAVALVRQHDFVASALLDDAALRADGGEELRDVVVHKVTGVEPGEETYSIAVAGESADVSQSPLAVLASSVDVRRWVEHFAEQQATLQRYAAALDDAERRLAERPALLARLAEAEAELNDLARLRTDLAEFDERTREAVELRQRLATATTHAEQAVEARRRVEDSRSWKLTAPLRTAGGRLRKLRP